MLGPENSLIQSKMTINDIKTIDGSPMAARARARMGGMP